MHQIFYHFGLLRERIYRLIALRERTYKDTPFNFIIASLLSFIFYKVSYKLSSKLWTNDDLALFLTEISVRKRNVFIFRW